MATYPWIACCRPVELSGARRGYGTAVCYPELVLVLLTGVGHVLLELVSDGMRGAADSLNRPQHMYNVCAVVLWGGYLAWRLMRSRDAARLWGLRAEGFLQTIRSAGLFIAAATGAMILFGAAQSRFPMPGTVWLAVAVYPVWGIAQQFALQALITGNLRELVPRRVFRVLAVAILFSVAHFPNGPLMALTFVAGVAFTWLYGKYKNIWAIGIVHGMLGALAYYLVLGQDPGAALIGALWGPH